MIRARFFFRLLLASVNLAGSVYAEFRAGAALQDISPTEFPTPINGSMRGNFANGITDPMHARALALSDGKHEIILCVVDACMIPREVCEKAKEIVSAKTGVPRGHLLISATHTHSAGTLAAVFQSDPDPKYVATVPERIAHGMIQAHANLEPAEIGWSKVEERAHVFNRRWLMQFDQSYENPFGSTADRALMNPGFQNKQVSGPSGPIDPELSVLAARSAADKRPLGLLACYSLHYVGGLPPVSADYYGAFAKAIGDRLGAADARYQGKPAFVGIMANGTSGNINNVNYAMPAPGKREPGQQIRKVASSVADAALKAFEKIEFRSSITLDSAERDLQLGVRKATKEELEKARQLVETSPRNKLGQFTERSAIYAREAILLDQYPDSVPVKLQAHRIGDLSIASIPCEVFVEIGLDLKKRTPFTEHFTISLANGYNGYLPTTEGHALGGYETWRARSSYLEVAAADKITDSLLGLLQELKTRR